MHPHCAELMSQVAWLNCSRRTGTVAQSHTHAQADQAFNRGAGYLRAVRPQALRGRRRGAAREHREAACPGSRPAEVVVQQLG